MMKRALTVAFVGLMVASGPAPVAGQAQEPFVPRPFPGSSTPPPRPAASTPQPSSPAPAPPPATAPALPAAPASGTAPAGTPVYPSADFLETFDAGMGQRYYIYGSNAAYADVVT